MRDSAGRPPLANRQHRSTLILLTLLALCRAAMATATPAAGAPAGEAEGRFRVPTGSSRLEIEDPQVDEKMGSAFVLGMRSGATNCYVESLLANPHQEGGITFVVKPPPKEGHYLVELERTGSIGAELTECVRGLFGDFYHYTDKVAFDRLTGTLRFTAEWVEAPAPPSEAELRAALDQRYAEPAIVKIVHLASPAVSHDVETYSSEVFRHYAYTVDLEFIADGFETTCRHYGPYKIFGKEPYKSPYAGHVCENHARKAGDRTSDSAVLDFRLTYSPTVAKSWELRGGGITGTMPDARPR